MVNEVTLIGRLGGDPELRTTTSGKQVASVSLATSEKYKDKEETTWHRLVAWQKTGELMAQYGRKGALAYVKGSIKTRQYEDKEGKRQTITEILVDRFRVLERTTERAPDHAPGASSKGSQPETQQSFTTDDIPF